MSQLESTPLNEVPHPPTKKERLPHSKWGCLKFFFILLAVGAVFDFLFVTTSGLTPSMKILGGFVSHLDMSTMFLVANLFLVASFLSALGAFILIVIGLWQPRVRTTYAEWGLFLLTLCLVIFGVSRLGL